MVNCLIDGDYTTKDDKPVLRLFYKNEEGSYVDEIEGFKPYFFAIAKDDVQALADDVIKIDGITATEIVKKVDGNKEIDALKVIAVHPRLIRELRESVRLLPTCHQVREADIPYVRRYIIDSGIVPFAGAEDVGLRVAAIDCEIACVGQPDSSKDPVHMISYADSTGFRRVWFWGRGDVDLEYAKSCPDERSMIEALLKTVDEQEINILTGYNTDNFDFPYFEGRAEKLKMNLGFGFNNEKLRMERRGMNMGAKIVGRPHIDMYPVCRQVFNLPRYQLEDVYESLFGVEKLDIKVSQIREFYNSPDIEKFKILCEYSMADADGTLAIALRMLPLMYEMSRVIRQPIYETSRMSSGQRVEQLLIEQANKRGLLVPNRPSDDEYGNRDDTKYEGAFVVDPQKGIHDNIILFDFRSLYPSIIISHNVDPATLDCGCCSDTAEHAPNNHFFCTKEKGFIPDVIESLLQKRVDIKKELREETNKEKKSMLDVKQQAMKLLANSMYGYYGFQRARWYCRECAEAIAGLGRVYIQKTISQAEKAGFNVIYGDTDSIYITRPEIGDVDEIIRLAKEFQKTVNESLPESMDLEFEGFYPRGVFITKKRYAVIDLDGKLTIKGLETRRRDWCTVAKETQQKVLDALLKDRDSEKAAQIVKDMVQDIKGGKVPLADLAINTQMTRDLGGYVSEGPHIAAVRKAMADGMEFKKGDIITYIVTKVNSSAIGDKAVVIDSVKEGEYDPDYYINNQLLPAVMRILEALGYQEDEMKGLGRQTTLGSW